MKIVNVFANFFFSSRRRHTRSKRDWSSDVCSSDLGRHWCCCGTARSSARYSSGRWPGRSRSSDRRSRRGRSEERRVGKECRYGRWRCQQKKKKLTAERRELYEFKVD